MGAKALLKWDLVAQVFYKCDFRYHPRKSSKRHTDTVHLPIERRYVYLVGKVYSVQAHRSKDTVASIKITSVREQPLGAVTEEEARAEGFESLAEFKASWDKRFGPFDPTQDVRRVEFRLVDKSELGSYDLYKLERVKRKRLAKETYPETSEAET